MSKDIELIRHFLQKNETRILVNSEYRQQLDEQQSELYREQNGLLRDLQQALNKQEEK